MARPILIIEDNAQNLYLMRYLLEQNGFSVVAAQDGQTGIEVACASPPLAILLDIQLPLMDGYAVARELRKFEPLNGIPIIAVTSYAMAGDREKALEAGATDYMEKPIDPDTFVDHVRRHIEPDAVNRP